MRDIPLEAAAERLGLERDKHDKHKWRGGGQILSINGQKFYDHLELKGGGGAIDLVMHLQRSKYLDAVKWLAGSSTLPHPSNRPVATQPITKLEVKPFNPPEKDERRWQDVRRYLTQTRCLPASLVDELHSRGVVYADDRRNAVFLRTNNKGQVTGANLRGTVGEFHKLAAGTQRSRGWFHFSQGTGKAARVVLTESPIDAMSRAALEQDQPLQSKTTYISVDGNGGIPAEGLRKFIERGGRVEIAVDNDAAGDQIAKLIHEQLPQAVRVKPAVGKDWNDQLQQARQVSIPASSTTTPSRPVIGHRLLKVKPKPAIPVKPTANPVKQAERDRTSQAKVSSQVKEIAAILLAERVLDAVGKNRWENEHYEFRRMGKNLTILAKGSGQTIAKRWGELIKGEVSAKDSIQISQIEKAVTGRIERERQPQKHKLQPESSLER